MNLTQNLWVLHENTYRIRVFWELSELPQTRCREIQASPLPHFIIQAPMSFAELNKASEVAAAHVPVPFSCSPDHRALWASLTPQLWGEARQQAGLGRKPNHLGKTQNLPITLCWVVCPTWSHSAKGTSTTSPQPVAHKRGDLFLPPIGSTERVIQIFQHALASSQALSEWGWCTSPLMLPKRETLTLSYTEGALRRHAPTWLLSPGKNFLLQQLFPTLTHKNKIVSTFPSF